MSMNGFEDNVKGLNIYKYFFGMSTIPNTKKGCVFSFIFLRFFFSNKLIAIFTVYDCVLTLWLKWL